jgi:hypothetical protein
VPLPASVFNVPNFELASQPFGFDLGWNPQVSGEFGPVSVSGDVVTAQVRSANGQDQKLMRARSPLSSLLFLAGCDDMENQPKYEPL